LVTAVLEARGRSNFKVPRDSRHLFRSRRWRPVLVSHPRSRRRPLVDLGEAVVALDEEALVAGSEVAVKMLHRGENRKKEDETGNASENANANETRIGKAKKSRLDSNLITAVLFPPASPGSRCSPNPATGPGIFMRTCHANESLNPG
jgi:hypothetical protein